MLTGRCLFVSDIHGQVDAFARLLAAMRYEPGQDRLVLLGDYVGVQGENVRCLRTIQDLCAAGATALVGNHDLALLECLTSAGAAAALSSTYAYIQALAAEVARDMPDLAPFLRRLPLWYEDEDFIAVHAGFNPDLADWRASTRDEFTTMREPFLSRTLDLRRTVIFGHTPCERLHGSPGIYFGQGKIGIDGGAGHGQQINGLAFDGQRYAVHAVAVRS